MDLSGHRPQRSATLDKPYLSLGVLACVLVGLPIGLDFEIIGRITGTDLAILALTPIMLVLGGLPPLTWPIRQLAILALVWFLAQGISDILNGSTLENMARGSARALITVVLIIGYFGLVRDSADRVIAAFLAIAAGLVIGHLVEPSEFALDDPWKFGFGGSVTMAITVVAGMLWRRRLFLFAIGLCLLASAINFHAGYRSMAGIAFMTGVVMSLSVYAGGRLPRWSAAANVVAAAALVTGAVAVMEIYGYAAQNGLLGRIEQEKYQSQSGPFGILLSGRAEILVSSQAVLDSPLWGHGSWAEDDYYADLFKEARGLSTYETLSNESDLIPTHSHLFGAWVEGGVLSALFWFYVIFLLARAVMATARDVSLAHPVLVFSLLQLSWAVLFSPYGLSSRALSCFEIVVAATVLRLAARTREPAPAGPPQSGPPQFEPPR